MQVSRQPTWDEDLKEQDNRLSDNLSLQLRIDEEMSLENKETSNNNEAETIPDALSNEDGEELGDNTGFFMVDATQNKDEEEEVSDENDHTPGGRYFGLSIESKQKCFKCGMVGHISRDCTVSASLPCFLCGGHGHQRRDCPEEVCYNCGRIGHKSRQCSKPRKRRMLENELCNRCDMPGHVGRDCSLNWRRYIFARELCRHDVDRAETMVFSFCYNCASPGHFGDECPNRRMLEFSIFHRPRYEFLQLASLVPSDGYRRPNAPLRSSPPKRHPSVERGLSGRTVRPREDHIGEARRHGYGNGREREREREHERRYNEVRQQREVRPEGYARRHYHNHNDNTEEEHRNGRGGGDGHKARIYTRDSRHPVAHGGRQSHQGRKMHHPEARDDYEQRGNSSGRRFYSKEQSSNTSYRYRRE